MEGGTRSPPPSSKPKFSVYQNPALSAALTARSLRTSAYALVIVSSSSLAASLSLLPFAFREGRIVDALTRIHLSIGLALSLATFFRTSVVFVVIVSLVVFYRSVSLLHTRKASASGSPSKESSKSQQNNNLTERQLSLLGLKPKPAENISTEPIHKPPKSTPVSPLVPIRKSSFSYTPSRPSRIGSDQKKMSAGTKVTALPVSVSPSSKYVASPATPWPRQSPGNAKGILTEAKLEQYLASVDERIMESAIKATMTPSPTIQGFGIASPPSVASSATASGATRSTPLRPVRMSPGSHQKYSTPPKKGEGELPPPMSMEQAVEAFESLGVYPDINQWRDRLRQWFSSDLMNPLVKKIETSHTQVMQVAASVGISVTVSQVGSDSLSSTMPVNSSPVNVAKEWQPTIVTMDEDGLLHQLRATVVQARDGSMPQLPFSVQQQPQQNPLLPVIQQCIDAITEHQRLKTLMKGELIKGLLPQSSVRADFTVQRVQELAEGTCLKNYDYKGSGDGYDKEGKRWTSELPTDSHLLMYLFCAFLEHPKWMLHVDPTSYSGAQSTKNPLFLGVLPPKDRFPEKYVAVISGVPSVIHPGACILSVGKQSPPVFVLYWDKKLQFSLQGRTALWDAILLLCHRIKVGYGGVVRGVHLGSSAFSILPVLHTDDEN